MLNYSRYVNIINYLFKNTLNSKINNFYLYLQKKMLKLLMFVTHLPVAQTHNVEKVMVSLCVLVFIIILGHHQIVSQNVSSTLNVDKTGLALINDVRTLVLGHVVQTRNVK